MLQRVPEGSGLCWYAQCLDHHVQTRGCSVYSAMDTTEKWNSHARLLDFVVQWLEFIYCKIEPQPTDPKFSFASKLLDSAQISPSSKRPLEIHNASSMHPGPDI